MYCDYDDDREYEARQAQWEAMQEKRAAARNHCTCNSASEEPCDFCTSEPDDEEYEDD
jgi:hypothetical protein